MMKEELVNNYKKIILEEIPLIDVRAPIEYEKGAFLHTINLPIMNNEERHLVGQCYKQQGHDEAFVLGHKLVSGELKKKRIEAWISQLNQYPDSLIYCFRGGSRSRLAQEWIQEATGKLIPRLEGGYKAFRQYLLQALEPASQNSQPIRLGGCTGSGKTLLLNRLTGTIDLEGIANHRGSSFGNRITPQPSQIDFENHLAFALIKHKHVGYPFMIVEDEGRHVGKCYLPKALADFIKKGKLVVMDVPFEKRLHITHNEYVIEAQLQYREVYGDEQGLIEWYQYILGSLSRLKKRLGGNLYKTLCSLLERAYESQKQFDQNQVHNEWIRILLKDYYDPMYHYQLKNVQDQIIFRGNTEAVYTYFKEFNT